MIVATVLTVLLLVGAKAAGDSLKDGGHKIVGGHATVIEKHPFQVSVEKNDLHSCGGSILNKDWILTAANCLRRVTDPSWLTVRVGSSTAETGGTVHAVTELLMHPKYDFLVTDYDVGLLRVKEPISFNDKVKPALLASAEPKQGTKAVVTGWGALEFGGSSSEVLQAVRVPIVSRTVCSLSYGSRVTDRMICAGVGGKDSCQGDSGGPLVDDDMMQVGVVSWGFRCAAPGYVGVYANLAHPELRAWIMEKAGNSATAHPASTSVIICGKSAGCR